MPCDNTVPLVKMETFAENDLRGMAIGYGFGAGRFIRLAAETRPGPARGRSGVIYAQPLGWQKCGRTHLVPGLR